MSKDASQVRQKDMIARHFDRLAAAPDTGEKTAYTFVPGNLTELLLSFDLLPVLPEINALQSAMRGKTADEVRAELSARGFSGAALEAAIDKAKAIVDKYGDGHVIVGKVVLDVEGDVRDVAAQMEIILTAYQIYLDETGDVAPYYYLPKSSFEGLAVTDLKGHIWVNPEFKANGTADALINFGMGERRPFENLTPGDFVNINRTNRTGHAVTFLGYINKTGKVLPKYDASVVGFKYFSSQGRLAAGEGGLDYRYAVFSKFGCPEMPYKRDCEVIYSADQRMLNTGTMLAPAFWTGVKPSAASAVPGAVTVLNRNFFNGITTDD